MSNNGTLGYTIDLDTGRARDSMGRFIAMADTLDARMQSLGGSKGGGIGALIPSIGRAAVGTAALAAAAAAAAAAFAALSQGLKLAAEFEQTSIAFETLTGSAQAAKVVMKEISELAIETPFQEGELQAAAKSLLAARVPVVALKNELKTMGNVAAATGADVKSLSTVYAQVAGKGKLYAEELQQFVEQGAGEIRQAVAEELDVTTSKLMEMMQAGQVGFSTLQAAMQRLAGEGGKWGQAMEKQSKTTVGLLSSLWDNINKILRLLAQPINDGPIKKVLTTAVDVASKASTLIEQALAQGKVGEALQQSLILGAKLGVNATLDFIASIPAKIKSVLASISAAVKAAFSGSFDAAKDMLGSFNMQTMRFDTTNNVAALKAIIDGAKNASKAMEETTGWAKGLDAVNGSKNGGGGPSDDQLRRRGQDMANSRNNIMGEIAQLKALAAGRKSAANEIEREMKIRENTLRIMRETGASEEQAKKLAEQKANLEDRIAGKRRKIRGPRGPQREMGDLSTPLATHGPLSRHAPLTQNGGLDGFYRNQKKMDGGPVARPGYGKWATMPKFNPYTGAAYAPTVLDVGGRVNAAANAPAAATRDAANASQAAAAGNGQADPALAKLDDIHAELTRIRTA